MPFTATKLGNVDPKINMNGRPKKEKSNRQLRTEALTQVARKLKPNQKLAVETLKTIAEDQKVKPEVRLAAAKALLEYNVKLIDGIYGKAEPEPEEKGEEVPESASVVSFSMVKDSNS